MNKDWDLNEFKTPESKGVLNKKTSTLHKHKKKLTDGKSQGRIVIYLGEDREKIIKKAEEAEMNVSHYMRKILKKYDII